MEFEVIDFHTHPFVEKYERIGAYVDTVNMCTQDFFDEMEKAGVSLACGSVIGGKAESFADIHLLNLHALEVRDSYPGRYIPGFHVHPGYIKESVDEIEFAVNNKIKMIGELVPYHHGWDDYSSDAFMEIADCLSSTDMILNLHIGSAEDLCRVEKAISRYKNVIFVLAHPGYGSGIELYGALKRIIDLAGYERILFGTDFPVTAFKTYISAVLSENITDTAKEHILCLNAKRVLKI